MEEKKEVDLSMDVTDVRTEEGLQKIKNSQRSRYASEYLVDLVQQFDTIWRKCNFFCYLSIYLI